MFLASTLCIDAALPSNCKKSLEDELAYQDTVLDRFFPPLDTNFMGSITSNDRNKPKCAWSGLKCDKRGFVTMMFYETICRAYDVEFDFLWLPSSVEEVYLSKNGTTGTIDTRLFPIAARYINMDHNRLSGTCALQFLPPHLEELSMMYNQFSSFGALIDIPDSLNTLRITWDACKEKTLYYGPVPWLVQVIIENPGKLQEIIPLDEEASVKDKGVFHGIYKDRIH